MKSFYIKAMSIISILCLGIIVYSNTFICSFHFDDKAYIVDNFAIRNFQNLLNYWQFYPCRFVTFFSLFVNYHFHQLNVFGYHLFNLAVHLATAIFVWWLILLTLSTPVMKENRITSHANLIALFAGLAFVSHPLQTEAVTYIWQRASCLAALFYVASLCFYIKSRLHACSSQRCAAGFYYFLSLIIAIVAMFTKENTVTLPLMILLYEISFFESKKRLAWRSISPFLLLLIVIPLTLLLTKSQQFQAIQKFAEGPGGTSPWQYLLTQFRVMVTYIRLLFIPLNQNLDYDYHISRNIFELPTFVSFLFLAGVLFWAKQLFSKYRLVSFSIFWFFLTLSLESSLFPLKNVIFEHRLYLPLVGYSLFLISGAYYLFGKNSIKMMVIILMMIVAVNSFLTYQRNKVWKDEVTLWNDAVGKSPHKARPYNNLGFAYYIQGNFIQAISDYNKAIEIDPNLAETYVGRGLIYANQGNLPQAISDYNRAIDINPAYADAYNNRGIFYFHLGNFTHAISDLTKAIENDPIDAVAYYNRGFSYAKQGNFSQAISDYNRAIEIDTSYADAYYNRGLSFAQQKFFKEAILDFNRAIKINPDYADAFNNRGIIYAFQGSLNQAIADFTQALRINPNDAEAYNNRNSVYSLLRKYNSKHKAASGGK